MKIAIFYNFLDNIGGAEMVTLTLAKELKADIYTTNINKEKINKMGFSAKNIYSIGKVPINAPYRQQLTLKKFRNLNLKKKYDFYIISGDWAISAAVNNKPNLEYFHAPLNEIFAYKDDILKKLPLLNKPIYEIWVRLNRFLFKKYFKHIQIKICNSNNTKKRIKKYLKSSAIIINPPIYTDQYKSNKHKNYWLSVNRFVDHKRVELQLKAFSKLPNEKLTIVGSYEKSKHSLIYKNYINKFKTKNIKIINWAEDYELKELYSNCKGFITTSKDEDFGMTVIEAMSAGKPVIAPNEGGYIESIIHNKTGVLINNISPDKIISAVKIINQNPTKYKYACIKQAKKFDTKEFIKKIKGEIKFKTN